jgi:hypothetical protein
MSFPEYTSFLVETLARLDNSSTTKASSTLPAPSQIEQDGFVQECEETIEQAQLAIRELDKSEREAARSELKALTVRVDAHKSRILLMSAGGGGKASGSVFAFGQSESSQQQRRLEDTNARLDASNQTLENTRRQVAEIAEVGEEIIGELAANRDTIERSHNNVRHVNQQVGVAEGIMKRMSKWWA